MNDDHIELSIVIPCLNEEDTVGLCIEKAFSNLKKLKINGEVILSDNGSSDKSVSIAQNKGAKIVNVKNKGYGAALKAGIEKSKGKYILFADADNSYDFNQIDKFYKELKNGHDLVQGCRLPRGGGVIKKGAMPWSHRHIGNPLFTFLVRSWFNSPINDVYCGMRAFKKTFYESLKMKCNGMEFATEMIIKSANIEANTAEVPITLHKDGRIQHPPHLRTIRDGWRTLQFFLLCAPSKLFLLPGITMCITGFIGSLLGYFGSSFGSVNLGAHTMLGSALLIVSGYQAILMHSLSLNLSERLGILTDQRNKYFKDFFISRGIIFSLTLLISGIFLWVKVFLSLECSNYDL